MRLALPGFMLADPFGFRLDDNRRNLDGLAVIIKGDVD
jgi:hypothetical protein